MLTGQDPKETRTPARYQIHSIAESIIATMLEKANIFTELGREKLDNNLLWQYVPSVRTAFKKEAKKLEGAKKRKGKKKTEDGNKLDEESTESEAKQSTIPAFDPKIIKIFERVRNKEFTDIEECSDENELIIQFTDEEGDDDCHNNDENQQVDGTRGEAQDDAKKILNMKN